MIRRLGRAIPLLLGSLLVSGGSAAAQEPTKPAILGPIVTVFASGINGPGWWGLKIDADGRMRADIVGGMNSGTHAPQLSHVERNRLAVLLAALPTKQSRYSFGKDYVDVSMTFILTVGAGKKARKYAVTTSLEEDAKRPEVRPILEALHFLHALIGSEAAIPPPPLDGTIGPK